jgi:hypothetical protein
VVATVYRRVSGGGATEREEIEPDAQGVLRYFDVDLVPGSLPLRLAVGSTEGVPGRPATIVAPRQRGFHRACGAQPQRRGISGWRDRPIDACAREVLDVRGRRLMAIDRGEEYGTRGVIDLSRQARLDAGLYLVRLVQGGESVSAKAVVVR